MCEIHNGERGRKGTGKDVFIWLARVELYLLASYLWMINEVREWNIEREKKRRKGKMFFISQITERKSSTHYPEQCYLKISWHSKVKLKRPTLIYSQYFSIYLSHFVFLFAFERTCFQTKEKYFLSLTEILNYSRYCFPLQKLKRIYKVLLQHWKFRFEISTPQM